MQVNRNWYLELVHPVLTGLLLFDTSFRIWVFTLNEQPFAAFLTNQAVLLLVVPGALLVLVSFWAIDVVRKVIATALPRRWLILAALGWTIVAFFSLNTIDAYTSDMQEWSAEPWTHMPAPGGGP